MNRRPSLPVALLAVVCFLAPVVGGQVSIEAFPLSSGASSFLTSLMGGPELPISTHAMLSCFVLFALAWVALRNRVLQTPHTRSMVVLLLFLGFVVGSTATSRFKAVSFVAMLEWIVYVAAFVAVVAATGRRQGPRILLASLVAGCTLVALKGIAEYASMRSIDPTWRVFAGWVNQNALAGMLILGLFPALSFVLEGERLARLLSACAAVLIGFALVLTQSKGGLLAAVFGLLAFVLASFVVGGWRRTSVALVPCAVVVLLSLALQASQAGSPGSGALGRIANAAATEQQSAGFRRLLWQSSLRLMRENPVGSGVGTFRFESAKPGLTSQTHFAHNTYLQLGVEIGVIGTVALCAFLLLWLRQSVAGLRRPWGGESATRIGILSTVAAALAHNAVDSDLYHFGIGVAFFMLLGIALQLAPDGAGPESVPRVVRWASVVVGCCAVGVSMLHMARVEVLKARLLGSAREGSAETVRELSGSLAAWAGYDGEAWYLRSAYEPSPEDAQTRTSYLRRAYSLHPSSRFGRAYARSANDAGQPATAISTLEAVLRYDPNNLPAFSLLTQVYEANGDREKAVATARRTIGVEQSVAFQIRAIPELVPTETYDARLFLASRIQSPSERIRLMKEAVAGYLQYLATTLPRVRQAEKTDPPSSFAGETLDEAQAKMEAAERAALELAELCRSQGDEAGAREASEAARSFAEGRV